MIGLRRNDTSYVCCACGSGGEYGVWSYTSLYGEMRLVVKEKEETRVEAGWVLSCWGMMLMVEERMNGRTVEMVRNDRVNGNRGRDYGSILSKKAKMWPKWMAIKNWRKRESTKFRISWQVCMWVWSAKLGLFSIKLLKVQCMEPNTLIISSNRGEKQYVGWGEGMWAQ